MKRLGVSEQNSVVERSSSPPPRKGNGGEDRRPTIFSAIGSPELICSSCDVPRSNRATAGAAHSGRSVQRDS
ncbi:MAG: hypothetical protein DME32_14280 [Verrucomicrobia bacterium]|nr:MAG: hypothetical protein DME32_14280 [Verrucomicrobiota bacterium]